MFTAIVKNGGYDLLESPAGARMIDSMKKNGMFPFFEPLAEGYMTSGQQLAITKNCNVCPARLELAGSVAN